MEGFPYEQFGVRLMLDSSVPENLRQNREDLFHVTMKFRNAMLGGIDVVILNFTRPDSRSLEASDSLSAA